MCVGGGVVGSVWVGSLLPLVEVQVSHLSRGCLGNGHLGVVVDDPASFLLDVAHVVTARRRGSHVTDKPNEAVS